MTHQKLGLFIAPYGQHTVLEEMLSHLGKGIFLMVGSGDVEYDHFFTRCMAKHDNFLFLNGYSEALATALYSYADLFVMPSIYEPCGISQMLAMRGGMPCIANATGGLKDTVINGENGFTFTGSNMAEKATNFINTTMDALTLYCDNPSAWAALKEGAVQSHFLWETSAKAYEKLLYAPTEIAEIKPVKNKVKRKKKSA